MTALETERTIATAARYLARAVGAIRRVDPTLATILTRCLAAAMDEYRTALRSAA